jgi:hypothetical protein
VPGRGEERADRPPLHTEVGVGARRPPHPAAGPAGQLPGRDLGAADDLTDLVEPHVEHVMQHERQALGRAQALQHDEQRHADRVGHHRLLLRAVGGRLLDEGLGQPRADVLHAMRLARPQHVQADPPDDGGQPRSHVDDRARVAAAEAQPGLLHGVLGLGDRAEHAVGDRGQVRAQVLELPREPSRAKYRLSHRCSL